MHITESFHFNSDPAVINKGPKAGHRYYLDGLYATLQHYSPKYCVEIGTNHGRSARVFQKYFDEHEPNGMLITCDIKKYVDLNLPNVKQIIVHPHVNNSTKWHFVNEEEILKMENWQENVNIAKKALEQLVGQAYFDFAFIDGDHQLDSVKADINVCLDLLGNKKVILLDDTEEFEHDVASFFHDVIKKQEEIKTYEFEDWSRTVGAAVLEFKDSPKWEA